MCLLRSKIGCPQSQTQIKFRGIPTLLSTYVVVNEDLGTSAWAARPDQKRLPLTASPASGINAFREVSVLICFCVIVVCSILVATDELAVTNKSEPVRRVVETKHPGNPGRNY